jgi:hypothetical protein
MLPEGAPCPPRRAPTVSAGSGPPSCSAPIGIGHSAPWKWRPCLLGVAPFATVRYGSSTRSPSVAETACSYPPSAGECRRRAITPASRCRPGLPTSSGRCSSACARAWTRLQPQLALASCVSTMSCTYRHCPQTKSLLRWRRFGTSSTSRSVRCSCPRPSWRWMRRCDSAGSCWGVSPAPQPSCSWPTRESSLTARA